VNLKILEKLYAARLMMAPGTVATGLADRRAKDVASLTPLLGFIYPGAQSLLQEASYAPAIQVNGRRSRLP
jgi:hypothetical protein